MKSSRAQLLLLIVRNWHLCDLIERSAVRLLLGPLPTVTVRWPDTDFDP
jgi:hypothetical protein